MSAEVRESVKALILKFEHHFAEEQNQTRRSELPEASSPRLKTMRPDASENRRTPSPYNPRLLDADKRCEKERQDEFPSSYATNSVQTPRIPVQSKMGMEPQDRWPEYVPPYKYDPSSYDGDQNKPYTSVMHHDPSQAPSSRVDYRPRQYYEYSKRDEDNSHNVEAEVPVPHMPVPKAYSLIRDVTVSQQSPNSMPSMNTNTSSQLQRALVEELNKRPQSDMDVSPLKKCIEILQQAQQFTAVTTTRATVDSVKLKQLETENKVLREETEHSHRRIGEMEQRMKEERQDCERSITERETAWKDEMYQMEQKFLKERQEYDRIMSEREDYWKKELELMVDQESKRILGEREEVWKQELGQMEQKFIKEMQENDRMLAEREEAWKQEMDQMINKLLEEKEVVYENFLSAQQNITEQMDLTESLWKQRLDQTMKEYKQKCEILEDQVKDLEYKLDHIRREWIEQETVWTDKERRWVAEKETYEKKLNTTKKPKGLWRKELKKQSISEAEQKEADEKFPSVQKFKKLIEEQKNNDMQQMITDINYLRRVFLIVEQLEAENDQLTEENNTLSKKELSTSQAFQEMEHKYNKEKQNYERIQSTNQKIEEDIRFLQERVQEEKKYKEQANSELKRVLTERDKACRDQNELREILWKQEQTVEQARLKIHKLFKEKEALYEKLQSAQQKSTDMKKEMKSTELKLFQSRAKRVESTTAKALRERLDLLEGLWKQKVEQYTEVKDVQHQLDCMMREWKEQEIIWTNKELVWVQEKEELEERMKMERAAWSNERNALENTQIKKQKRRFPFRNPSRKTTITPFSDDSDRSGPPSTRHIGLRQPITTNRQHYHPDTHAEEDRSEKTNDPYDQTSFSEPGPHDNDSAVAEPAEAENVAESQTGPHAADEDDSAAG